MSKLSKAMIAGAAALVLTSSFAGAADSTKPTEEKPRASENQSGDPGAVKSAPEQASQDREYMAALKKCDNLNGGEKQKCTDAAQRKINRM